MAWQAYQQKVALGIKFILPNAIEYFAGKNLYEVRLQIFKQKLNQFVLRFRWAFDDPLSQEQTPT